SQLQIRNLSLIDLRLPAYGCDELADHRQILSGRRNLQCEFSFDGVHLDIVSWSERRCDRPARRAHGRTALCRSDRFEMLKSSLLIVEHFKNILKAQNLECVSDFGREAANLDVAASVAHLLDEAHKDPQTGGRDIVELFAVDHYAN